MFFSHLLSKNSPCANFYQLPHELQRLVRLDNAVQNYGGGLSDLYQRLQGAIPEADAASAIVMTDVAQYLQDVAEAGQLELHVNDWCVKAP